MSNSLNFCVLEHLIKCVLSSLIFADLGGLRGMLETAAATSENSPQGIGPLEQVLRGLWRCDILRVTLMSESVKKVNYRYATHLKSRNRISCRCHVNLNVFWQ